MIIGITGHQRRKGIQWLWVERAIYFELSGARNVDKVFSSLAAGSDQVFAQVAIRLGIPLVAVVPLEGYDRFFKASALAKYRILLGQSALIQLRCKSTPDHA